MPLNVRAVSMVSLALAAGVLLLTQVLEPTEVDADEEQGRGPSAAERPLTDLGPTLKPTVQGVPTALPAAGAGPSRRAEPVQSVLPADGVPEVGASPTLLAVEEHPAAPDWRTPPPTIIDSSFGRPRPPLPDVTASAGQGTAAEAQAEEVEEVVGSAEEPPPSQTNIGAVSPSTGLPGVVPDRAPEFQ